MAKKNKDITDSINYARRIQEAMLPEKEILKNWYPESFIIYHPKAIVSGDFYWMREYSHRLVIAIADCTGHGVPGALMSILSTALLNEIGNADNIPPGEILEKLNKTLRKVLKQDGAHEQTRDGLDIALCSIDKHKKIIEFAGANRHLFYFKGDELHTIKGNKYGIGGRQQGSTKKFTNHKVSLKDVDSLYLFTDGYVDQFGGEKGKKMLTKIFTKLLKAMQSLPANEQEKLLKKWLKEWKGPLEQTDDILIMGLKLK